MAGGSGAARLAGAGFSSVLSVAVPGRPDPVGIGAGVAGSAAAAAAIRSAVVSLAVVGLVPGVASRDVAVADEAARSSVSLDGHAWLSRATSNATSAPAPKKVTRFVRDPLMNCRKRGLQPDGVRSPITSRMSGNFRQHVRKCCVPGRGSFRARVRAAHTARYIEHERTAQSGVKILFQGGAKHMLQHVRSAKCATFSLARATARAGALALTDVRSLVTSAVRNVH